MNEKDNLTASETTTVRAAVSDAVEKMNGINRFFAKHKKYCEINTLSEPDSGVGLFDLQGAKYDRKFINGSFVAQYPFSILLRKKADSDRQNLEITSFMDRLGAFLENCSIPLSDGRKATELVQTVATFENSRTEDNIVTLQANFLLKYRKDDEDEWQGKR